MNATDHDPALEAARVRAGANLRAWEQVLDQLEADVAATEELIRSGAATAPESPTPWQSPPIDGPLPDQLLGRARQLHERQTAAQRALAEAVTVARTRREQARRAVGLGSRAQGSAAPAAYVDVSA